MEPYSGWDDIVPQHLRQKSPPPEDFSHYFSDYKNIDNLFNDTLTNLQDLDVPSGYGQSLPPPQSSLSTPYKHAKKPSGTAIFGYLDHNRELSIGGLSQYLNKSSQPQAASVSPSQLARQYAISNEQLDFNFSQPLEECKPILLNEDEEEEFQPLPQKKADDLIVTNSNPRSYKFPPDPVVEDSDDVNNFLHTGLTPIRHPKQTQQYPDDIEAYLDTPSQKRYVPIPVQEPSMEHHLRKDVAYIRPETVKTEDEMHQNVGETSHVSMTLQQRQIQQQQIQEQIQRQNTGQRQHLQHPQQHQHPLQQEQQNQQQQPLLLQQQQSPTRIVHPQMIISQQAPTVMKQNDRLNMNMNVFLPPPSTSLSNGSPEPASPLPQIYSSPIQNRQSKGISSPFTKKAFYNPQFFSDDTDNYYFDSGNQLQLSPLRDPQGYLSSSPVRFEKHVNESFADETTTDINETIIQLTPLRNHESITPSKKPITLEWSPIISPNGKASSEVRKAIQDLSPRKTVKKTSLLPAGELDRYWEGPDEKKVFTCTYKNCGKKFTRRYNVRSHIQTHLSDRPFSCSYCPKSFVRQHDLNRHVKSHLLSKHCRCKCGKEFTRVEGYRKHLANGVCSKVTDTAIVKPGSHRIKTEPILDGLTSNRLHEDLGL